MNAALGTDMQTRRILILTVSYPPKNIVSSYRPAFLAKYLTRLGWDPFVVTSGHDGRGAEEDAAPTSALASESRVIRINAHERQSVTAKVCRRVKQFAFPERHPPKFAARSLAAANTLLANTAIHAIWATTPLWAPHWVAACASRTWGIPWIADFRDTLDQRLACRWYLRKWSMVREKRVLRTAAAIVTVSAPLAAGLSSRHGREVVVIPNGYDPEEDMPWVKPPEDVLSIAYTGRLFAHQNPASLFTAIERLVGSREIPTSEIRLEFYGTSRNSLASYLDAFSFPEIVRVHERRPRQEILRIQRESHILLVLPVPSEKGIYTAKVFEYLGARRPILCVPGDGGCVDALIQETGAGFVGHSPAAIARTLLQWYHELKTTGSVRWQGREAVVGKYSWDTHARKLDQILQEVIARNEAGRR